MSIEGLEQVKSAFKSLADIQSVTVTIEFTGEKDILLHEDLQTQHENGQPKYLEQPLRQMIPQLFQIISSTFISTKNLRGAVLTAGNVLLSRARELYPAEEKIKRVSGRVRIN